MSIRTAYITSFALGLLAWGALAALVTYTQPDASLQLAVSLALLLVAISATTMPFWGRIHQRLSPNSQGLVIKTAVRQGLWTGLFVIVLLLFHFIDLLDWILVLVTLMLFVLLEAFLQQRDRWKSADQVMTPQPKASKPRRSSPASSHRAGYSMARTKKGSAKQAGKKKK
ncbi:MAG TPA: hypothetical protein G4N94_12155 [Caldilineae bacterium]|nr:hypothetical protein [Caldilineae bacterium]